MPFFDVHAGDKGAILAIGWTGGWKAEFAREGEKINVKAEKAPEGMKFSHWEDEKGIIVSYDEHIEIARERHHGINHPRYILNLVVGGYDYKFSHYRRLLESILILLLFVGEVLVLHIIDIVRYGLTHNIVKVGITTQETG